MIAAAVANVLAPIALVPKEIAPAMLPLVKQAAARKRKPVAIKNNELILSPQIIYLRGLF